MRNKGRHKEAKYTIKGERRRGRKERTYLECTKKRRQETGNENQMNNV